MSKTLWFLDTGRCLGRLCLFASLLAAAVLLIAPGEAAEKPPKKNPILEEALQKNAPDILHFLWKQMKHPAKSLHVGVLKFLVQIGDQPSDNAGPLNLHIARRLEAALILALDENNKDRIRILHNPSAVVWESKNFRANPFQKPEEGRKAFFNGYKYPPAWGDKDKKISAHVFLTGLVKIADGARTLEVTVQAFDSTGKEPVEVCNFKVAAEPRLLTEAGVSFALSRGSNAEDWANVVAWNGRELPPKAITSIPNKGKEGAKAKEGATVRELLEQAPIDFQVLYNGDVQKVGPDGTVPEPREKTTVTFRLAHKGRRGDKNTYGVVLKINGENTIYPEELEPNDFRAHKWVLSPKDKDGYPITGYLKKNLKDKAAKFTVLSKSESKLEEGIYGPHAGTFTIVIFQERPDGKDQPDGKELEVVRAISRGVPDQLETPNRLKSLQDQLRKEAALKNNPKNGAPRGVIVEGPPTKQAVKDVEFHAYPTPVSVIHVRYYKLHNQE